jgi:hypothetical protein
MEVHRRCASKRKGWVVQMILIGRMHSLSYAWLMVNQGFSIEFVEGHISRTPQRNWEVKTCKNKKHGGGLGFLLISPSHWGGNSGVWLRSSKWPGSGSDAAKHRTSSRGRRSFQQTRFEALVCSREVTLKCLVKSENCRNVQFMNKSFEIPFRLKSLQFNEDHLPFPSRPGERLLHHSGHPMWGCEKIGLINPKLQGSMVIPIEGPVYT